jgi:hypothetical protein
MRIKKYNLSFNKGVISDKTDIIGINSVICVFIEDKLISGNRLSFITTRIIGGRFFAIGINKEYVKVSNYFKEVLI